MSRNICITLVCACLALTGTLAQAAVTVYPAPIQFGSVALNSTGYPVSVYLTNTSATAVTISSITVSGTSSANFSFGAWTCIGIISGNQSCQMYMTFTPSALGTISANLLIAISGVTTPISIQLQGTGGNPIPNVTSLSPQSVYANSPTTTITVNGSGFVSSSLAYLQNSNTPLPTTYVSATQIKTQMPDTVLGTVGTIYLYVANPQPGGGTGYATLQVVGGEPSIGNVTPGSIMAGTPSEPILIDGQNFMSGATVQWNGTSVPTTYISPSQLQSQPTTAQLASPAMVKLSVSNPAPGTISQTVNFDLTAPINITVLDLPANDLVWDPFAQMIYASLPSSYGTNGNSIAVINPSTGAITGYHFAGSEPNKLAIDSTSKYLYVGLNGNGSVQRLALPAFTPDINIGLGRTTNSSPNLAGAIAVSPTNSHMIAVALGNGCCGYGGPLEFFTDSSKLASSVTSPGANQIIFANGTTLYGYYPGTLSQVNVTSTGGTLGQTWTDLVTGSAISYSGGLILGGDGQEFNPVTGLLLGTFDTGSAYCCNNNGGTQILSNSAINRALVLGQTPFFNSLGITSYNLTQFTPVAVANLSELNPQYNSSTVSKFMQWSTNGMAFILSNSCCGTTSSQVVLVQSPTLMLTATRTASAMPVSSSLTPGTVVHGAGNFRMAVRGSGFVPGSIVTWNGKKLSASYVSGSQMTAYVTKAAIASAGTATIAVQNPAPGGGKSNTLTLTIK
jgi:trimeric autotransporter adhesin